MTPHIPFIDLSLQQTRIRPLIDAAIARVLDNGSYILGKEVTELESDLTRHSGAKHVLSCSNGTDALALILRAKNVSTGDAIFVPSFTFAASAEVIAWMGAEAIFVDVDPHTFNMDPESLKAGIQKVKTMALKPKGIIAVGIFGQPADMDTLSSIAHENNLWIMDDAAQSYGAFYKGKRAGNLADYTTTSFYPAKPLGCYGDGGAVFCNDDETFEILKSLRVHGQGTDKYENVRIGMNARLDTIQAAVLIEKLKIFDEEFEMRQKVADRYTQGLSDVVKTPFVMPETQSSWAQYTTLVDANVRSQIVSDLNAKGIPTCLFYANPLHTQKAYCHYPLATNQLKITEDLAGRVICLPMSPYISKETQDYIIENFRETMTRYTQRAA
ncbi:DegT/DnrJ/EryC1/StrS aminotransferase family protein [Candidatus Bealeia paramacronuclearis]|uniref:DegT/DnrJ/EryC1/StrS aminotransferase family protein n=2 Tax=Candidatus Bealeia paramacronuclearis TaxID=1921001 RepID=A0ABZ2C510_9PROT|nr:DegT/DnrJ/EryC1/StrS aminotransferase family protein [Candidatus Bealeia paramacronuclearis]